MNALKMIDGSESKASFAVIAENSGIWLAVRPLLEPLPQQVAVVGLRIRAVPGDSVSNLSDKTITAAFPKVPFAKKSKERCSITLYYKEPMTLDKDMFLLIEKKVVPTLKSMLEHMLEDTLTQEAINLSDFLIKEYRKLSRSLMKEVQGGGVVLEFPSIS